MAATTFDYALARKKYSVAIQSSLPKKDLKYLIEATASLDGSDNEKKPSLDQAFRDVLWKLVVEEHHHSEYLSVIQLSIDAVENSLASAYTPFLLLGDLFDTVTIETCKEVFKFVEAQVLVWKSDTFYIAGKNYILRMCNDLLRRLSKSQNTVFCGRIQLFLARYFPLDERSGLNLMSQFNLANVTTFNTTDSDIPVTCDSSSMDVAGSEVSKTEKPIDYILYRKFWSLQDFFRNPTQCYKKEKWRQFQKYSKVVLDAFSSLKLDSVQGSKSRKHQQQQLKHSKDQVYFAKFLTSEKLFDLQLRDSSFRRSVLVQFLILYQYLNQTVKFKTNIHVMTDEMNNHIKESSEVVYTLLRETPPNGEEFAKTVSQILSREEHWNDWKNKGCPTFVLERPKAGEESTTPARIRSRKRSIREELTGDDMVKRRDMGSPELTKLWNICPDNMEACRSESRIFLPNMEEFFEEAIEQADPEAMIEEQYKVVNESNFAWQAIRILARKSPHFFQPVIAEPPIKKLSQYLEWILTKIAKEMPQTSTSEEIKTGEGFAETDDLLQGGEEEKSDVLTETQLEAVIGKVGENWKVLAGELFLSDDDITNLQTEHSEAKEQARQLMKLWQEREGESATREALVKALQESGLMDIVESVFSE